MADLKALGEPVFTEIEDLVAATPGHGYFICRNMTFKTFPSGAHALAIGAEYTKVYVAGWLQQGDKKVGVRLHYQTAQAGTGTLPERGHTYEMSLKGEHTLDVELPEAPELYEFVAHDKTQLELAGPQPHHGARDRHRHCRGTGVSLPRTLGSALHRPQGQDCSLNRKSFQPPGTGRSRSPRQRDKGVFNRVF